MDEIKRYTLTLLLNPEKTHVLMCDHKILNALNFIGGKINKAEDPIEASYRELEEETGVTNSFVNLTFIRHEIVQSVALGDWSMYITAGVLTKKVILKKEKYNLIWVDINDKETFINAFGLGNCWTFLQEALQVLK